MKLHKVLKQLINYLSIISFIVMLTYCTEKREQPMTESRSDSGQSQDATETNTTAPTKGERWSEVREKVNKEEMELNSEMRELETKATNAKADLRKDIHKETDKIKADRDKIKSDSLNPEFSNVWDSFVAKSKNTLDSLRKKI